MLTAHDQVETLLEQLRGLAGTPAADKISAQISLLCRGYMAPACDAPLPGVHLTPNEGKLFALLRARLGHAVNRGALLDAASFHHGWDHEPGAKVVDVYICRLRRKLAGTQYRIETEWGRGYRMVERAPAGSA